MLAFRLTHLALALLVCALVHSTLALAQSAIDPPEAVCESGACTVSYSPNFFARYAPVTALDMVENLPGFTLDDGGGADTRGFGGAAGNVLINSERVSAKSENPSSILGRIPAADVDRIDLIRGQVGGLDLQGQTVVADVIRKAGAASGAWTLGLSTLQPQRKALPFGEASYSSAVAGIDYTLAVDASRYQRIFERDEQLLDPADERLEFRDEIFEETGERGNVSLIATTKRGVAKYALNASFGFFDEAGGETSDRAPVAGESFRLFQGDEDREVAFEIGGDIERPFGQQVTAKLIGLYRQADFRETNSLVRGAVDAEGVTETETLFDSLDTEAIARVEVDFAGLEGHLFEASLEGALNSLDSEFALSQLEGDTLVPQDVPGANTQVDERRLDFSLADTFKLGAVSVNIMAAGEASTITQTGGFAEDRSFFFWKPSLTLTYSPKPKTQLRARVLRQVAQLDFFDFVSRADLGDVELSLGNPNLVPERTLTVDMTLEYRFGSFGVLSVTGFHDRIQDVQDVLPLEGILEVPGNIGSGRRSGMRGEATLSLDELGLANGRLDLEGSWQTSSVNDPLNGVSRALSGERPWTFFATLRQDLQKAKFAWQIVAFTLPDFPSFGLDEEEARGKRFDADAFIETRAVKGLRIRLQVEDLFRGGEARDRLVFAGPRNTAQLAFRELRNQSRGRTLTVQVSGSF
ncbi:MAG: TonB-dependent receptor [Pseudomonadota bacterium]